MSFSLIMNCILIVCLFPVLPILYFIIKNMSKPKKNIVLGVTLPFHARQDESTLALCGAFRKRLRFVCLLLVPASFMALFIPYWSIVITWHNIWLLAVILAPYAVYAVYHQRLKRLKQENGWTLGEAEETWLDTKAAAQPRRRLSAGWFIPPVVLSLAPVILEIYRQNDRLLIVIYIINALLTVAFYLFYRALFKQRSDVTDADAALNIALTRVRQYNWGKLWLGLTWSTGLYNLFLGLFMFNMPGFIIGTAVYTVAVLTVVLNALFSSFKAQEKLTQNSGAGFYTDDDKYWISGLLYYNPRDRHSLINDRIGIGMTVNMAKPAGKILTAFLMLFLVALPLYGFFFIPEEFTPARLEVAGDILEARHVRLEYTINMEDIRSADLLETLPGLRRRVGTNTETLYKGQFRSSEYGECEVCLNPQQPPFILIIMDDGTYVVGDTDGTVTQAVYNIIVE